MVKYALVRWTKEDKVFVISTSWIIDFDDQASQNKYVAEWREAGKKRPREGWPCFEIEIIEVSDNLKELKVAEKAITGGSTAPVVELGKRVQKMVMYSSESEEHNRPIAKAKIQNDLLTQAVYKEQEDIMHTARSRKQINKAHRCESSPAQHPSGSSEDVQEALTTIESSSTASTVEFECSPDSYPRKIFLLQQKVKALEQENDILKTNLVEEIPMIIKYFKRIRHEQSDDMMQSPSTSEEQTIEISPGSGVRVSRSTWAAAVVQNSCSSFARVLLMGLFTPDVLINSNLTGGASKVNKESSRRTALDREKIEAIIDATQRKSPGTKRGDVGKTINGKINELRFQMKRKTENM